MADGDEEPEVVERYCRVRVWFGSHVIHDFTAVEPKAALYEQGMRRRFAGLRVTSEPAFAHGGLTN